MSKILLQIDGIDVSEYVLAGYETSNEPVYDQKSFTNIYGDELRTLIGHVLSISVTLGEVPDELAERIEKACDTDSLSVTFASPAKYTAKFKRPSFKAQMICESPASWDISLSMNTGTIPIHGL